MWFAPGRVPSAGHVRCFAHKPPQGARGPCLTRLDLVVRARALSLATGSEFIRANHIKPLVVGGGCILRRSFAGGEVGTSALIGGIRSDVTVPFDAP
jgi:hypothetical protein